MSNLFDAFVSFVEFILNSEIALVVLTVPLFINLLVRFVNLLCGGLELDRRPKYNSSCNDWEKQFDALISEHDESCQNVKSILSEKK